MWFVFSVIWQINFDISVQTDTTGNHSLCHCNIFGNIWLCPREISLQMYCSMICDREIMSIQKCAVFGECLPVCSYHSVQGHVSWMIDELIIEILWKLFLLLTLILMIQSGHKLAHVTTAELSWHVQNCDIIWWLLFSHNSNTNLCKM